MEDAEMTDVSKNGYRQFTDEDSRLQNTDGSLRNNPFRVATACLGLLCVLLLVGVIVQSVQHQQSEQDHQTKLKAMNNEKVGLQENLQSVHVKKRVLENYQDQLKETNHFLTRQVDQLQSGNNLLTEEKNNLKASQSQLEANKATLSAEVEQLRSSRDRLQTDSNALMKDKELLQRQHNLVLKRKTELHANLDSVTKERENLQSKIKNASRDKDELITSHKNMTRDVGHLEERLTSLSAEIVKAEISHQAMIDLKSLLQEDIEVLKKSIAELEKLYVRHENKQRDLRAKCKMIAEETEKIQHQNNNMTAEKDRLQEEIQRLNSTLAENKCSSGWRKFENSCYFTAIIKKSWNVARTFCQDRGADLATVKTSDQRDFINGLYANDEEVWIGLTDEGVEGQWKWVDGTQLTTAFWAKGQPNNHKGKDQDCVEFWHRRLKKGEWNDESCDLVQKFICQK